MNDIESSYDSLIDSMKANNQREAFAYLFDLIASSLAKSIPLSRYQFANSGDQQHFERQINSLINQVDEMYDFANGKMVEEQ